MNNKISYPCISVHPNHISLYQINEGFSRSSGFERPKIPMPKSNYHNNKISSQARRKMGKAVDYLVFLSSDKKCLSTTHGKNLSFKISFITLTLSSTQVHSDNEIKSQLLNQFIIEARKKWNVKNYIWRAERQKNGNLHFHIITDRFIPWNDVRNVWNRIQNKLGYVDRYREQIKEFHKGGFKVRENLLKVWSYKKQLKAYKEGIANDFHNPNSTDIHSIKLVTDTKAYMMKYLAKSEQSENMKGRLWGCNYELTNLKGARIIVDSYIEKEIRSTFTKGTHKFYKGDHFTVIYIPIKDFVKIPNSLIIQEFIDFLINQFGNKMRANICDIFT